MDSLKLCGAAVIALACMAALKQLAGGIMPSVRVAAGIAVSLGLIMGARPAIEYVGALFEDVGFEKYASPILKGGGIAVISHICATVCRDSGENTLAECVEIAGRVEIFLLCIPLMTEVLSLAKELMGQ